MAEHGIVAQPAELAGPHAGARQQFDHEPPSPVGVVGQGGHELGRGGVVQKPGQGLVGASGSPRRRWGPSVARRRSPIR